MTPGNGPVHFDHLYITVLVTNSYCLLGQDVYIVQIYTPFFNVNLSHHRFLMHLALGSLLTALQAARRVLGGIITGFLAFGGGLLGQVCSMLPPLA